MNKSFCDRCGKEMSSKILERHIEYIVTNYPIRPPFCDMCKKCVKDVANIQRKNQNKIKNFIDGQRKERENFVKDLLSLKKRNN